MSSKYSQKISIEKAKEDYTDLIKESIDKQLWFKAKGLNLWLSPYELQDGWEFGKYLQPVSYWMLANPNEYLRPHSKNFEKAKNTYDYAHKRYKAYIKRLSNTPINI
tara:strand:- start:4928 stop:5248 length:321 start_codon:yes stop_codon:yes gene_type:complete